MSNIFAYKYGLNIQDPDTDHDGINDVAEYHYWQNRLTEIHPDWDSETINDTAVEYRKLPGVDHHKLTYEREVAEK